MNNTLPPPPPPPKPFRNPYQELPEEQKSLVQVRVDTNEYKTLQAIRPGLHTISAVFGTIFQKLMQTLNERGIHDMSNEQELVDFINTLVLTDQATYEQLRIDSTNWQQHTLTTTGRTASVERGTPLGRGLHDSSTGGSGTAANAPLHGATVARPCASSAPVQDVVSDVQSKGARKGKRKSRADHQDENKA